MAAKTLDNRASAVDSQKLVKICRFVSRITNRPIPADRPITGEAVFSYESGIHCAAVLKDPNTYQPFSPETVGRKSAQLVVGGHSGSTVIRHLMEKAGVTLNTEGAEWLLAVVRIEAMKKKPSCLPVNSFNYTITPTSDRRSP